jgi:hypothetical protein
MRISGRWTGIIFLAASDRLEVLDYQQVVALAQGAALVDAFFDRPISQRQCNLSAQRSRDQNFLQR